MWVRRPTPALAQPSPTVVLADNRNRPVRSDPPPDILRGQHILQSPPVVIAVDRRRTNRANPVTNNPSRQRRPQSLQTANATDGRRTPRATPQAVRAPKRRRALDAEAEENLSPTASESCDESSENAGDLYRSAILGVHSAQRGRQQVRAATTHCPVCAKLAALLDHFK